MGLREDIDEACMASIKRRMEAGAVDSRIMVRAGWVDALRQRAEQAEGEVERLKQVVWDQTEQTMKRGAERDAAREQVAALREALESMKDLMLSLHEWEPDEYTAMALTDAALTADATQAGERWRAMSGVIEAAQEWGRTRDVYNKRMEEFLAAGRLNSTHAGIAADNHKRAQKDLAAALAALGE